MMRLLTLVEPCRPCDNTASAALMKGWISSIFIELRSRSGRGCDYSVFAEHVLDDFVEHFGLNGFLDKMASSPLQRGDDVLLISDRGDHDDARFGMLLDDPFGGFDAFHLRHGDVHEHDVRMRAVELADGSQTVAGFSCHLPAERFDHAGQVLTGKHGVIHDQITHRLPIFAAFYWCKLLHTDLPFLLQYHGRLQVTRSRWSQASCAQSQFPARTARPACPASDPDPRPTMACSVEPIMSRPTTRMAYPRSIAAFGMP